MSRARDRTWTLVVAVALCGVVAASARPPIAGGEPKGAQPSNVLRIKPGELTGRVLYTDGKTPAAKAPVRVWSVGPKKFVFETLTDPTGAYKIPKLSPGRYVIVFGDRVRVEVVVAAADDKLPTGPLNVIIPRGRVLFYPAQVAKELAAGAGASTSAIAKLLSAKVILIGATATAVGVVAGHELADDDDDDDVVVSP